MTAIAEIFLASHLEYSRPFPSHLVPSVSPSRPWYVVKTCDTVESILLPANKAVTSCQKTRRVDSVARSVVASPRNLDKV